MTPNQRVDGAFSALAYAGGARKGSRSCGQTTRMAGVGRRGGQRPRPLEQQRRAALYGTQVNALLGLTHRLAPDVLVGVFGGYETFDYRSDELAGRLRGDGWTIGSYLGWRVSPTLIFDVAAAYSGIGYDGTAGTASGDFAGNRLLLSSGFTGTYRMGDIEIEPSAKIYALWEHENAYTDSLGTPQDERTFATGRAPPVSNSPTRSRGAPISHWHPSPASMPIIISTPTTRRPWSRALCRSPRSRSSTAGQHAPHLVSLRDRVAARQSALEANSAALAALPGSGLSASRASVPF